MSSCTHTETSDPNSIADSPLATVLMITFNHAAYLAEAIEGVVNQRCNFNFELIIGEDASTDSTLRIALDYQRRYPSIIRVIHSKDNVGMNLNSRRIFEQARGKYIAYCEGDDHWCSPTKLALQVAMMERDNNIGIVHTDWTRSYYRAGDWHHDTRRSVHRHTPMRYLRGKIFRTWHFPKILRTCTILLRRSTLDDWYASGLMDPTYHFGDSVLSAYVTSLYKVGYIPEVTAVYRVSPGSALRSGPKARVQFYYSCLQFDTAARQFFAHNPNYPDGFRWDVTAGLLAWGARARDSTAVIYALKDFQRHFSLANFIHTGMHSIIMRLPRP